MDGAGNAHDELEEDVNRGGDGVHEAKNYARV